MLCYSVLCYAMPGYAMLYYATLCYAMLYCAMLCHAILCYAMLYCAMLCYAVLYEFLTTSEEKKYNKTKVRSHTLGFYFLCGSFKEVKINIYQIVFQR